jgi:hypothetical protein
MAPSLGKGHEQRYFRFMQAAEAMQFDRIYSEATKVNNLAGLLTSRKARNGAVAAAFVNNTSSVMVRAVVNTAAIDAANIVTTANMEQQEQETGSCDSYISSSSHNNHLYQCNAYR